MMARPGHSGDVRYPGISYSNEEYRAELGESFIVSKRYEQIGDSVDTFLFFNNPPATGKTVSIAHLFVLAGAKIHLDVFHNPTQDTAGTARTIHNTRMGDDSESLMEVESGGTYSGLQSDPIIETIIPGGQGGAATGAASSDITFFLEPGNSLLVRMRNKGGAAQDFGITVRWTEFKHRK